MKQKVTEWYSLQIDPKARPRAISRYSEFQLERGLWEQNTAKYLFHNFYSLTNSRKLLQVALKLALINA